MPRYFIQVLAVGAMLLSAGASNADVGDQLFKLLANDGAAGDLFGFSVAISGTTAIAGSLLDDDNGSGSGSAYLFDAATGTQIAKLLATDGAQGDLFGSSVAISGTTAIVGAIGHRGNGGRSGSAYLFDTTTGAQIAKFMPADGAQDDRFGWSVAISGTTAIVGALRDDDNGTDSGSVYVFDTITGAQITKLLPEDGAAQDIFGNSVAISEAMAIVGARMDDDNGADSGSAYLFDAGSSAETSATLTSFGVETGALLNGDLADLGSSNDSYVHTRSGFGSSLVDLHNMEMRISATTTVQAPATLELTIESHISEPVGTARIRLFNFTTGRFDFVGQHAVLPTDIINTILDIDATNYVNDSGGGGAGDIEMSIKHLVFVPFLAFTFESFIDHVKIVVR